MKPEDQLRSETIQPVASANETVREQDKIMLVLAYLLPLIPLLTVKDSEFVKWHSKQGLVLAIGTCIAAFVFGMIPILGCIAVPAVCVAAIVFAVLGIMKSLKGERYRIPLVADLADKF